MASKPSAPPTGGAYTALDLDSTCIATVRDFVVVGAGTADLYSIRWSAIGDPTDWPTPATDDARSKQSGTQAFPTRFGNVTAIGGNDFYMYVFQESAISKGTYVGGDVVFSFDTFEEGRGCKRHGLMTQIDDLYAFESVFGYHLLENEQIMDIGYGIIDS